MPHTQSQPLHWTSLNYVSFLPWVNESSAAAETTCVRLLANRVFQAPSTRQQVGLNPKYVVFLCLWWLMDKSHLNPRLCCLNQPSIAQDCPKSAYVPIRDNPNLHVSAFYHPTQNLMA